MSIFLDLSKVKGWDTYSTVGNGFMLFELKVNPKARQLH